MENFFYLDTSIWLDIYLRRGRHGEIARTLLLWIIAEDKTVLFSNYIEKEFRNVGISQIDIHKTLWIVKPDHFKYIYANKEQIEEARNIAKQRNIPFGDVLHAILARDNDAQLISRDRDFKRLKDITQAKMPEELF